MTGTDRYRAADIERRLAEDPRTAEMGIRVTEDDDRVYLRGEVASPERRDRVAQVVAEREPGRRVVNDITVTEQHWRPAGGEEPEVLQ